MNELTAKYRTVFNSAYGQDVLADILTMTHFGCSLSTEVQMIEHNLGIAILAKMGVFSPHTKEEVIRALQTVSPKEEEAHPYGELKPEGGVR